MNLIMKYKTLEKERDTLREELSEKILEIEKLESHRIAFSEKNFSVEKERNIHLENMDKAASIC